MTGGYATSATAGAMMASNSMGGQPTEPGLPPAAVIGAFDPGDDRVLSGVPAAAVEDVLLQQGQERFHGRGVTGCPDPAHRSDPAVTVQAVLECPRAKWAARSLCRRHPETLPRRVTALVTAFTASSEVMRSRMK